MLRQLVGAEGAHADARRPPVQVQVGNSVELLGLTWRRFLRLSQAKFEAYILLVCQNDPFRTSKHFLL